MKTSRYNAKDIELWDINRLRSSPHNPRTHSKQQVRQIAGSIAAYGFMTPISANRKGHILAGYGRLLAAQELGLERVPVIVVDHLSETEERAYALADNRIALNAGWNDELLEAELAALATEGVDLKSLGFEEAEFDAVLAKLSADIRAADEDALPDGPVQPVSRVGDTWLMEQHRLQCNDALHPAAYSELLEDGSADMAFGDLPYNVRYLSRASSSTHRPIANDDLGDAFPSFLSEACGQILRSTKGSIYICMSSSELHTLYQSFVGAGGHWSTFIIWAKDT